MKTIVCLIGLTLVATVADLHSEDIGAGGIIIRPLLMGYEGPCPVVVHFRGTIYHTPSHVKVRYRWERTHGKRTREQLGEIPEGGLEVGDDFAMGRPGHSFVATDRLHVWWIEGKKAHQVTRRVESTGTCIP